MQNFEKKGKEEIYYVFYGLCIKRFDEENTARKLQFALSHMLVRYDA